MKLFKSMLLASLMTVAVSCDNFVDDELENEIPLEGIDYTKTENMINLLTGSYALLYDLQWENFPTIAVRGDDVNAAGDQVPLIQTDIYSYDRSFWMYNAAWTNLYSDVFRFHANMEEIEKYKEFAPNPAVADQYIAEIRVMRAFTMLQMHRLWGPLLIPASSDASGLYTAPVSSSIDVLEHIVAEADAAAANLPTVRPNQRTDIPGGVTKHTALAIKAMAALDLNDWQTAADASGEIIESGLYSLYPDYYELFKIPGKLADENLLELQYSDLGLPTGGFNYLWDFFGPNDYTPSVAGAGGGWGFWEPSMKYIEFMINRDETVRLETSVLFTNEGIGMLTDAGVTVPGWVSNTTRDGDIIGKTDASANPRAKFSSGKHYLPSNQLTAGRTSWGSNKNFICIRYAEVLLMYAEAVTSGATPTSISATDAVNEVRDRADMDPLGAVTLDIVLDEKFAEFGMEWGIRFYDLVRHGKYDELDYEGRSFNEAEDIYISYPLLQLDLLPQLREVSQHE